MIEIDYSNVLEIFTKISLCDDDQANRAEPIIKDSISCLEKLIDEDRYTEEHTEKCEYTAAVWAFYSYLCAEGARERMIVTMSGKAASDEDISKRIPYAQKLKEQALRSVGDILKNNEFVFRTF